jgi:hypothetical protein
MSAKDLETLVLLIELAALDLTNKDGDTFTVDELIHGAVNYAPDLNVHESDLRIVLPYMKCFHKQGNRYSLK